MAKSDESKGAQGDTDPRDELADGLAELVALVNQDRRVSEQEAEDMGYSALTAVIGESKARAARKTVAPKMKKLCDDGG